MTKKPTLVGAWAGTEYRGDVVAFDMHNGTWLIAQAYRTGVTSGGATINFETKDPVKRWKSSCRPDDPWGSKKTIEFDNYVKWFKFIQDPTPWLAEMVL